ncbi:unnamed protein product [Malus baccata var. baccata]
MKKAMLTIERYQRKCLPLFDDKSSAEASTELRFDIGGLVVWDVDETDEKQQKYVDDLFKMQFRQWKFNVQQAAECAGVDDAATDDQEEE